MKVRFCAVCKQQCGKGIFHVFAKVQLASGALGFDKTVVGFNPALTRGHAEMMRVLQHKEYLFKKYLTTS